MLGNNYFNDYSGNGSNIKLVQFKSFVSYEEQHADLAQWQLLGSTTVSIFITHRNELSSFVSPKFWYANCTGVRLVDVLFPTISMVLH